MFARSIGFAAGVFAFITPCLAVPQTRISAFEYDPATGLSQGNHRAGQLRAVLGDNLPLTITAAPQRRR